MDPCLTDTELSELVAGKLPADEERRARAHLAECLVCAELLAAVSGDAAPPAEVFGRYHLSQVIGEGAFATVYRAHDPSLGRDVAVKVLHTRHAAEGGDDPLLAEAHSLARLAHPNVVTIHDVGTRDGRVFLAMELGRCSLRAWLAEQPRAPAAILRLLRQAGEGLDAAHRTGLVHRDVKPDNILIAHDGRALVTDFGLARAEGAFAPLPADAPADAPTITVAGFLVGTPSYMAPEQLRGDPADERSDQYAFCVTVFEALSGRRPFRARKLAELRAAAEREEVDREAAGRLPRWLARILLRGLRADPARRWPTLRDLLDALRAGPPLARPAVRIGLASGLAAVVAASALVWGIVESSAQRARAERRFADVRKLATSFLFEFDEAIERLPGALPARRLVVERAQQYLDVLAAEARDDDDLLRELATAYVRLFQIQGGGDATIGDTPGARRSLARAIAIREELARRTGRDQDLAELAEALLDEAVLDPMSPAALQDAWRALSQRELLASRAPDDIKRKRGVARAHFTLAELHARRGAYADTIIHHRAAAAIYDRLAAEHPDSLTDLRNAALAAKYLGAVLQKTGDQAGATALYRKATGLDGLRVAASPFDGQARLDLSYSVASLANALLVARDLPGALAGYRQALALREAMANADPANVTARATVARARRSIAIVRGEMGDLRGRRDELLAAEAIYARLSAGDRADLSVAARLAETWVDLGETELRMAVPDRAGVVHLATARAWLGRAQFALDELRGKGLSAQDTELLVRAAGDVSAVVSLAAYRAAAR